MLSNNILTNYADDKFRLRAFNDYCKARKESYSKLIETMNEAIAAVPDDGNVNVDEIVNQVLSNHEDIPADKYILFNNGYATVRDILTLCVKETANTDGTNSAALSFISANGSSTGVTETFEEVCDEMKQSLHSVVTLIAANEAAVMDNFADKIAVFTDSIKSTFSSAYSDLSNTSSYYREILSSSTSVKSYLTAISQSMKTEEIAANNSLVIPANSDISNITGASPLCGLASGVDKGFGVVGQAINAGVKVIAGVIGAVGTVAKSLFGWVGSKIHQVVANPYDIEENSDGEEHTIDGWCYNYNLKTNPSGIFRIARNGNASLVNGLDFQDFEFLLFSAILDSYSGKWIKMSTKGGDLMFKWNSCNTYSGTSPVAGSPEDGLEFTGYQFAYKPKSLSNRITDSMLSIINRNASSSLAPKVSDVLEAAELAQQSNELYSNTGDSELDLYNSFANAIQMDCIMYNAGLCEAVGVERMNWISSNYSIKRGTGSVTNADFVSVASGWTRTSEGKFDFGHTLANTSIEIPINPIMVYSILTLAVNLRYESANPYDFPFLPYRVDKEGISSSKFIVKTDDANRNAFTNFIAIATVIVIAAVVSISAVVIVKKISKSLYYKALSKQSILNQKLWNGQSLTNSEMLAYRRATRRLEKSKYLSSGIQSAVGTMNNESVEINGSTSIDLNPIVSLLK